MRIFYLLLTIFLCLQFLLWQHIALASDARADVTVLSHTQGKAPLTGLTPAPAVSAIHTGTQKAPDSTKENASSALSAKQAMQGVQVQSDDPYLRLINWANPYEDTLFTLVRLSSVIDKGLVSMRAYHLVESEAGAAANQMFRAAAEQGIEKFVIDNAYRSRNSQEKMWKKRIKSDPTYGLDPYTTPVKVLPGGVSEHETGLALDIFCKSHRKASAAFGETEAGRWLSQNAHIYGYILRYPKDKQDITGIIYEPWHFRYVGIAAAKEIFEKQLCLEEYLYYLNEKEHAPKR